MLYRLSEIEDILASEPGLFVRFSDGFAADLEAGGIDQESGLRLPGLPARPLDPESWWTRPVRDWVARQLTVNREGPAASGGPGRGGLVGDKRFGWLLRGTVAGHGLEGEPLIADVEVVGRLADCLLDEAQQLYSERFLSGRGAREADLVAAARA